MLGFGILCFVEARAPLSTTGHRVVQLGGVLLIYGLLFLWLHVSQGALLSETYDEVTRQAASRTASPDAEPDTIAVRDGTQNRSSSLHPQATCHKEIEIPFVVKKMSE
jgi:hypothetical protein